MARHVVWRTVVPAVGLAAALAVGWRLSPVITVLVVVCAWLPLALWCLFAPRTRAAMPIALALLVAVGTIRWTLPGEPGDRTAEIAWSTLMWYSLAGLSALLVARWCARVVEVRATARTAGRSDRPRWLRMTASLVIVGALVLGCFCGGLGVAGFTRGVIAPSPAELLPLPTGMYGVATVGPDGEDACDYVPHSCTAYYRITGRSGESVPELTERVWQHLREAKGWDAQQSCRPVHWFFQRRPADFCIYVTDGPASTLDRPTVVAELMITDLNLDHLP